MDLGFGRTTSSGFTATGMELGGFGRTTSAAMDAGGRAAAPPPVDVDPLRFSFNWEEAPQMDSRDSAGYASCDTGSGSFLDSRGGYNPCARPRQAAARARARALCCAWRQPALACFLQLGAGEGELEADAGSSPCAV